VIGGVDPTSISTDMAHNFYPTSRRLQEHGPIFYVAFVGVDPALQGQGLGSMVVARMCEDADKAGDRWLALSP